jgi:hypothetical protein
MIRVSCERPPFASLVFAPSFATLLEYTSLRGPHASHASPLSLRSSTVRRRTSNTGPFQGQGSVWNLLCSGGQLSGNLQMRSGETL